MAKAKRKSGPKLVFSTDNCSHSLNDPGEQCCFCFGTVPVGSGRAAVVSERWVLPTYPPTPPPDLNEEQIAAWQRGIDHAYSMEVPK